MRVILLSVAESYEGTVNGSTGILINRSPASPEQVQLLTDAGQVGFGSF